MRDQVKVGPGEALRILAGFRSEAIDKLNEHTDAIDEHAIAIECHVERFIELDKRIGVLEARQRADEDRYVALKLYVERLEKRIKAIDEDGKLVVEAHWGLLDKLDKRITEAERYANSVNSVLSEQINDIADRIAKLEDRVKGIDTTYDRIAESHIARLDELEQCLASLTLSAQRIAFNLQQFSDAVASRRSAGDRPANPEHAQG